jgi:YbgC/YbaW family acyl-CoA thioester hydrolase
MARIKLQMPENFLFTTQISVRITDINYGNHLGNDSLLSIIHEARMRFLKSMNYSEDNVEGMGIMLADAAIVYKSQAFYGDELTIEIGVGEISKKSCDLYYRITKTDDKVVALSKTSIVFYDYQSQKPVRIPNGFLRKLNDAGV